MIVNSTTLFRLAPIVNMMAGKKHEHTVTSGLGEAGYDIRIKQEVIFYPNGGGGQIKDGNECKRFRRHFVIASAIEEFNMPSNLVGIVHDKSSWARKGLSVFNTVIEPGWKGFLTLELVYHGDNMLIIPPEAGIAQVVFHRTTDDAYYEGKYQHQENNPVEARVSRAHD